MRVVGSKPILNYLRVCGYFVFFFRFVSYRTLKTIFSPEMVLPLNDQPIAVAAVWPLSYLFHDFSMLLCAQEK